MEIELDKLVELGLISVKDAIEFAKDGYTKWIVAEEMIQDVMSRQAAMQCPRTGEITEQEKKEWMETLAILNTLNLGLSAVPEMTARILFLRRSLI